MTFTTGGRADDVQHRKLAGPVRPPVNPFGSKPVAVTDDKVIAALRRHETKIERELMHQS
jgi:hypothetical protein